MPTIMVEGPPIDVDPVGITWVYSISIPKYNLIKYGSLGDSHFA